MKSTLAKTAPSLSLHVAVLPSHAGIQVLHSVLEDKQYLARFGLCNRIDYLEGILYTKRNEYDFIIKPITVRLQGGRF